MVKLAFHDNCLCERGTTISVYDYAYYNKYLCISHDAPTTSSNATRLDIRGCFL